MYESGSTQPSFPCAQAPWSARAAPHPKGTHRSHGASLHTLYFRYASIPLKIGRAHV